MMFVETLWPDFGAAELKACVDAFALRDRRFGGL
jgi:undecaprenyl diphosphate synthase